MVFVLNNAKQPLMPCAPRTARVLLRAGKARVVRRCPFTIQLLQGSSGYRQEVVAALDTGSTVVGSAAVANGKVVYQAEVTLRQDISKKMEQRRSYRRSRRGRKTRYRQPRFDNRAASTRTGRLAPSLQSKLHSHLREVGFVESILPVTRWKLELAAFDIHKIVNPEVCGIGYQQGAQKEFYNVKQYVLHRDSYVCQSGRKIRHGRKLHVHHIVFRSEGGTDAPDNLVALCETCHADLHAGQFEYCKKGRRSRTRHATEMGILKSQLAKSNMTFTPTFGYETKYKREQLGWPKTHANDAVAACLEDGEAVIASKIMLVKQHIARGDYKQTAGSHSEQRMPTGKLFGFKRFDKVSTPRGTGFVRGKRSTGYFNIAGLDGGTLHASEKVQNLVRLSARSTTQVEQLAIQQLLSRRKEKDMIKQKAGKAKATMAAPSAPFLSARKGEVSRSKA